MTRRNLPQNGTKKRFFFSRFVVNNGHTKGIFGFLGGESHLGLRADTRVLKAERKKSWFEPKILSQTPNGLRRVEIMGATSSSHCKKYSKKHFFFRINILILIVGLN